MFVMNSWVNWYKFQHGLGISDVILGPPKLGEGMLYI